MAKLKVRDRNKDKSALDKLKAIELAKAKAKKKMPGKKAGGKIAAKKRGKTA